jgi:hypothetical protein
MDRIDNEIRDRLEKQYVNDHGRVQIRPWWKKFNVRRVVGELTLMWISLWLITWK